MKDKKIKKNISIICYEIQQAIIDVLVKKTMRAAREYGARSIILGGGVVANKKLREEFSTRCKKIRLNLFYPPKNLCTDNAAMIAIAGYFRYLNKKSIPPKKVARVKANGNLAL